MPLSKYYTTPGKKQTVVMPFADFTQLAIGPGQFDFKHLKDWTFVDPKPLGQPFVFSNMILLGGAPGCCPPGKSCPKTTSPEKTTSTSGTTATSTSNPNGDKGVISGSASLAGQGFAMVLGTIGFIYLVFAI